MEEMKKALAEKSNYTFDDLCDIMSVLRSPEGCPWDREQNHMSIRKNFIEETYEVCEAIDDGDSVHLCEELGDVMLQVAFHAQMEKEKGTFNIDDVINGVCRKLIHRHPHVFGNVYVKDADNVMVNWDAIKKEEKGQKSVGDVLESISRTLPALMRAQKLIKKADKNGIKLAEDSDEFDALDAEGYADTLMKLCRSAQKKSIDLEELLDRKCTSEVKKCRNV